MNTIDTLTEKERKFVRFYAGKTARRIALSCLWFLAALVLLNVCLTLVLSRRLGFADLMACFFIAVSAAYFVFVLQVSNVLSKLTGSDK